jgi:Uma2 family endonuclease
MAVRHAFTVHEWHRMGDAGLFGEDARLELLDGEVIEMAPIGSPHGGCVNRLTRLLVTLLGEGAVVAPQNPVVLNEISEPHPDIAVLAPRDDMYSRSHATPGEILLLIEVAGTSLTFDRGAKASYYAASGVAETWVVDLEGEQIFVMRSPGSDGYDEVRSRRRGDRVEIEALPGVAFDVEDVLGPGAED